VRRRNLEITDAILHSVEEETGDGAMRRSGGWVAGCALVLLVASSAMAKGGDGGDPKKHLDKMTKKLELTDAQRGQVEQIMTDYRGRMQALKDQMAALQKEKREKIKALLNTAQQEKFDKMKHKKSRGWFKKRAED
jgi:Spy/CpxP family protein refolding chaperone